ncbi:alpha/beta hydrolase [Actinomadura barringtoniae]|uniref:Alpha/beta hydrolase n=1 Tax=Actinomadura barringtoniae TaxID=1427535 RepID=A0A939P5C6_9ACTN|nr:alpha/beta hydrolase [Actinomadura barringtoniae]MBO2445496.1 alpha/beta hydrolase [Actinomadura barringtoniae]
MDAWWRDPRLGVPRRIELPYGQVEVFEAGEGEPVVFVHGLLVNANLWRGVVPRLDAKCIVIDMPFGSHKLSMPGVDLTPPGLARIVADVIEKLGVGPVTLVGNDSGGAVSQLVATTRPDLVARLVLTSCDAYDNFPPKAFGFLKLAARVPGALSVLLNSLRPNAFRRLPIAFGWLAKRIPAKVSDTYVLPAMRGRDVREDLRRALVDLHPRHTLAAAKRFAGFDRPVLIAWSDRDHFFPLGHAERLAADFPDARLKWISGAMTFSPEDQPEQLAAAISDFMSRVEAQ